VIREGISIIQINWAKKGLERQQVEVPEAKHSKKIKKGSKVQFMAPSSVPWHGKRVISHPQRCTWRQAGGTESPSIEIYESAEQNSLCNPHVGAALLPHILKFGPDTTGRFLFFADALQFPHPPLKILGIVPLYLSFPDRL